MKRWRVVWKKGAKGGKWTRVHGPSYWNGGTCLFQGMVLIYSEIPDSLIVDGNMVRRWHRYRQELQFFCPIEDVEAIFNQQGEQVYPLSG